MPEKAEAQLLKFPGTPVKQVTVAGGNLEANVNSAAGVDPGKAVKYSDASDELGVVVLDAAVSKAIKEIFAAPQLVGRGLASTSDRVLSASQIVELGKSENPWIVRYCAERGKPYLTHLANKEFLMSEFEQEAHVRVAAQGGSMCMTFFKHEAHAFAVSGGKLVHIYLIRTLIPGSQSENHEALLKSNSVKFRSILSTIQWE